MARLGITYTEALAMPDQVREVYASEYAQAERRPWRVAQWVVMWLAVFLNYTGKKKPKQYDYFDPWGEKKQRRGMDRETMQKHREYWAKIDAAKAAGRVRKVYETDKINDIIAK